MEKKYYHILSNDEKNSLLLNLSFSYILENYKQPDWCNKHEALNGLFGCEKLLGINNDLITKEFCKTCPNFKDDNDGK